MSAAQILNERGSKSGREALVIGETYPWRRDHSSGSIDGFASLEAALYLEDRL